SISLSQILQFLQYALKSNKTAKNNEPGPRPSTPIFYLPQLSEYRLFPNLHRNFANSDTLNAP
ncbi:hypothetical protein, partial [Corynebacterium stationis]|uniref:hypothetical protein n=1 Tax=Corynebacterium stationis TaxID=1705 RepID=UPI00263BD494